MRREPDFYEVQQLRRNRAFVASMKEYKLAMKATQVSRKDKEAALEEITAKFRRVRGFCGKV